MPTHLLLADGHQLQISPGKRRCHSSILPMGRVDPRVPGTEVGCWSLALPSGPELTGESPCHPGSSLPLPLRAANGTGGGCAIRGSEEAQAVGDPPWPSFLPPWCHLDAENSGLPAGYKAFDAAPSSTAHRPMSACFLGTISSLSFLF